MLVKIIPIDELKDIMEKKKNLALANRRAR